MNNNQLDSQDLSWIVKRLPTAVKDIMKDPEWHNSIFVGGGFIRAIISGEKINDVDLFVKSQKDAELLAYKLCYDKKDVYKTDNAYTIKTKSIPIQIIYRWVFEKPEDVSMSFDFTICCAVISYNGNTWESYCDERLYKDIAGKRLVYRNPIRNEDAGGSMLRVLKYYQKDYRIPLDSLGNVIARLMSVVDITQIPEGLRNEKQVGHIITGLLREVDPNIDPLHESHLPAMKNEEQNNQINEQ